MQDIRFMTVHAYNYNAYNIKTPAMAAKLIIPVLLMLI